MGVAGVSPKPLQTLTVVYQETQVSEIQSSEASFRREIKTNKVGMRICKTDATATPGIYKYLVAGNRGLRMSIIDEIIIIITAG